MVEKIGGLHGPSPGNVAPADDRLAVSAGGGQVSGFEGAPRSAGGAAAVEEGGEGGEDDQERDGPQQRGGDRVLHGPGLDGRGGVGLPNRWRAEAVTAL